MADDFKSMSDEELLSVIDSGGQQTEQQDFSSMSDEELLKIVGPEEQSTPESRLFEKVPDKQESQVGIIDRLKLSFADDAGREAFLKEKFNFVERLENGKFAVGDTAKSVLPIDPEGVFNDVVGDLADIAGEIPVIAGQIAGAAIGTVGATPGAGTIVGGGIGAGLGEAVKIGAGKLLGVRKEKLEKQATDVLISTTFGAAGEGLAQAASFGAKGFKTVIARKLSKAAEASAKKAGTDAVSSPFVKTTAKLFKALANVPEESTETVFKHGVERTLGNAKNLDKRTVIGLVDDLVKNLDTQTAKLGKEVGKQTDKLIKKKNQMIDVGDFYTTLRKDMIDLGVLDDVGRINRNTLEPKNLSTGRKLLSKLLGSDKPLNTFPETTKFQMPLKKLLRVQKELGDNFDGVTNQMKSTLFKVLNGDVAEGGASKGIRGTIKDLASKTGSDDYVRALDDYSNWINVKSQVSAFDKGNPASMENFIKGLEIQPEVVKRSLRNLNNLSNTKFLDNIEMWNAAQDFASSNPNLLRFGAIAAALGSFGIIQGELPKPAALGGALLLGTPAGLKLGLRAGAKAGGIPKALSGAGSKALTPQIKQALTAILSQAQANKNKSQ